MIVLNTTSVSADAEVAVASNQPQKQINRKIIVLTFHNYGGQSEIRTHEGVTPLPVFKTGAFNRSAICPFRLVLVTFPPNKQRNCCQQRGYDE